MSKDILTGTLAREQVHQTIKRSIHISTGQSWDEIASETSALK